MAKRDADSRKAHAAVISARADSYAALSRMPGRSAYYPRTFLTKASRRDQLGVTWFATRTPLTAPAPFAPASAKLTPAS